MSKPFSPTGGLRLLQGRLGRAVIKISAVKAERHVIEAPALVFHDQNELTDAFKRGEVDVHQGIGDPRELERAKKIPNVQLVRGAAPAIGPLLWLAFNTKNPKLADKRVVASR